MPRRTSHNAAAQTISDQQPIEQNVTVAVSLDIVTAATSQAEPSADLMMRVATPKNLTGKLAGLVEQISQADGATIADLMVVTAWQSHTIRAALSRLRRRGHTVTLSTGADGRKAYRLLQEG